MADDVKPTLRSAQGSAALDVTRRRVVEAAGPLFVDHGYASTSIRAVADQAGVAVQTIYNAFGSKAGLLRAVIDAAVAGDPEPVAIADRLEALDLGDNATAAVEEIVGHAVAALERLRPLYPALRSAAESDGEVADAHRRYTYAGRRSDLRRVAEHLDRIGAVPPAVGVERCTDILWVVLSPDAYELFVTHRGWTPDEVRSWAIATIHASALRPPSGRGPDTP